MIDDAEEEGIQVGMALTGCSPPNLGPLVDLLRSDRPISPAVRDMLASMIDPASEGYLYLRFELEDAQGKVRNMGRDLQNLEIAAYHGQLVSAGKSANTAAIETGHKFGLDQRRVYSRLAEAKKLRAWFENNGNTDKN